jgi:hypothetical protein
VHFPYKITGKLENLPSSKSKMGKLKSEAANHFYTSSAVSWPISSFIAVKVLSLERFENLRDF